MGHHHQVARPGAHDGLDLIVAYGNRPTYDFDRGRLTEKGRQGRNWVRCHDGFTLSVAAGGHMRCHGRNALTETTPFSLGQAEPTPPYIAVEVGYPSARPEPWDLWSRFVDDPEDAPWNTVYNFVPVVLVRYLLDQHGGFHKFLRLRELIIMADEIGSPWRKSPRPS